MSDIILEARDITLIYKTRINLFKTFYHKALDKINFKLKRGEVFGITGRNGSGKSSLLKVLAGVLTPDSGQILIPDGVTRSLLSLGLGFNPNLTGRDNAILSCMLNGLSKKQAYGYIDEIWDFSELEGFFDQPMRTYSVGMKSRLGFATGVITQVDILLIDEALSVGDQQFKKKAEKVMLDKLKGKQTVVFVSHNKGQVNKLCDRILKLEM